MSEGGLSLGIPREAISALIAAQTRVNESEDLPQKLTAIAEGIVDCHIFRRALVTVYSDTPLGSLRGACGISDEDLAWVAEHAHDAQYYRSLSSKGEPLAKDVYFISHHILAQDDLSQFLQSRMKENEFEDWHPDDMFLALLHTSTAGHIGNVSCDDPVSGKVPRGDEIQVLGLFVNEVANILETEVAKRTDGFTGLANEVWMAEALEREQRSGRPFSLLYGALQDGDVVSERLGRAYRDSLIKATARIFRRVTPRNAWCARVNGSEFVMVMRGEDPGRLEQIREYVMRSFDIWNEAERAGVLSGLGLSPVFLNDPGSIMRMRIGTATRREDEGAYETLMRAEKVARKG